jgi:hypothetical protein
MASTLAAGEASREGALCGRVTHRGSNLRLPIVGGRGAEFGFVFARAPLRFSVEMG